MSALDRIERALAHFPVLTASAIGVVADARLALAELRAQEPVAWRQRMFSREAGSPWVGWCTGNEPPRGDDSNPHWRWEVQALYAAPVEHARVVTDAMAQKVIFLADGIIPGNIAPEYLAKMRAALTAALGGGK